MRPHLPDHELRPYLDFIHGLFTSIVTVKVESAGSLFILVASELDMAVENISLIHAGKRIPRQGTLRAMIERSGLSPDEVSAGLGHYHRVKASLGRLRRTNERV